MESETGVAAAAAVDVEQLRKEGDAAFDRENFPAALEARLKVVGKCPRPRTHG